MDAFDDVDPERLPELEQPEVTHPDRRPPPYDNLDKPDSDSEN
ncbi:MAG: hypothetical protein U0931_14460 [Vulcanimicrobiota bacterium]